ERAAWVTWLPTPGEPVVEPVTLPPLGVVAVTAPPALEGPVVSAMVEADGGGVAVEHELDGPAGRSVAPCASGPANAWYLAGGGGRRRAAMRGVPVPPGTTVDRDAGADAGAGRRAVTAAVVTARTGRLVVDRIQGFDGSAGRFGHALTLAVPGASAAWWFPEG